MPLNFHILEKEFLNKIFRNKREKILISIALVLYSAYILSFKIMIPFILQWSQQTIQIQRKKELIKKTESILKEKKELEETFATLSQKIQAKLPSEREESQFLTEVGKVAYDTNVHIATMNPRPFRELGAFKELSVEIDLEANLGNLVRFLYQMRKSSVVLVANRLWLQPKSERSALLKAHLVISTIFLKKE